MKCVRHTGQSRSYEPKGKPTKRTNGIFQAPLRILHPPPEIQCHERTTLVCGKNISLLELLGILRIDFYSAPPKFAVLGSPSVGLGMISSQILHADETATLVLEDTFAATR